MDLLYIRCTELIAGQSQWIHRLTVRIVLSGISMAILIQGVVHGGETPNILFCISDDQSYAHAGANGDQVIRTPGFDRVAREGIRFSRAFCDAPTCGPSRSAILTGQPIWRLEEAGNIHSTLPAQFMTYTELLEDAGYFIGYTGKGWSPGKNEPGGRTKNPAGDPFNRLHFGRGELENTPRPPGVASNAYSHNFHDFLEKRPASAPFCFWLGTYEPHRGYKPGLWDRKEMDPSDVEVPPIFPDETIVREDILDYYHEIEHFDDMVVHAIELLEEAGELENTIIVVTSDHGMPFPRAKASLYDAGSHIPLAIRWGKGIQSPGRVYDGLVNLSALAPTFLESAGVNVPDMMIAQGLTDIFTGVDEDLKPRQQAYIAMERHDGCREGGKGYPCRAIRTAGYLLIHNFKPERWPAGDPDRTVCARDLPYGEVDSSPTKTLMMEGREDPVIGRLHELAFGMRPEFELYDLSKDPHQMKNVAGRSDYSHIQKRLSDKLDSYLKETGDPRALGEFAPWDYYPYYGLKRNKDWTVDPRP